MVLNVINGPSESVDGPSDVTIQRWQNLFQYWQDNSVTEIENDRNKIARKRVSDALWEVVLEEKEQEGHDRESHEHELELKQRRNKTTKPTKSSALGKGRYIFKIDRQITIELSQTLSESPQAFEIKRGNGDDEEADFAIVTSTPKQALQDSCRSTSFNPTFIRVPEPAAKHLSRISKYPTLGLDTARLQHRPSNEETEFLPAQNQYLVWFFFYGTLADPAVLSRQFGLSSEPVLFPASIQCGILRTWAGKYRDLVDGTENEVVEGHAFEFQSSEQEDAFRAYETAKYEVVRCVIEMENRRVPDYTFRFGGSAD